MIFKLDTLRDKCVLLMDHKVGIRTIDYCSRQACFSFVDDNRELVVMRMAVASDTPKFVLKGGHGAVTRRAERRIVLLQRHIA